MVFIVPPDEGRRHSLRPGLGGKPRSNEHRAKEGRVQSDEKHNRATSRVYKYMAKAKKNICVVVNKWWEADPVMAVLANSDVRP